MNIFLKSKGMGFYFCRLLCIVLAINIILLGVPIGVLAQEGIPARIVINPEPFGVSDFNVDPGTRINYKATLYDKTGRMMDPTSPACGGFVFQVVNPIAGRVIGIVAALKERALIYFDRARGAAQVVAFCKKKPDLKGRNLVSGTGGLGPFEPTEIESWIQNPPPPLLFSETQREYLARAAEQAEKDARAKAEIKPTETPAPTPTTKAGPNIGPALLIGGVVAAGAIAIGAAAGGLGGGGDGGSGGSCSSGYAPCGNYKVCCPDLYKYCPSTGRCCRGVVYGWASCCGKYESGVTCHW